MEVKTYTSLQELSFPPSFFEDEVREGFFVSGMMKRCWAAQLKALAETDRICKKYGIVWYLDSGSLLGAVRHKGFIPWDDDLDICMMRDDLERFLSLAENELPSGYLIGDVRRSEDYLNANMRIITTEQIDDENTRSFYGFPYTAGVDVFALDGVFPDKEREQQRLTEIREIYELCAVAKEEPLSENSFTQIRKTVKEKYGVEIFPGQNVVNSLLRLLIPVFSSCAVDEASEIQIYLNAHDDFRMKKEWYAETVMLPFEHLMLPAPVEYVNVMKKMYGNIKYVARGGAYHSYPYYTGMEEYYKGFIGHNPFRYTLSDNEVRKLK